MAKSFSKKFQHFTVFKFFILSAVFFTDFFSYTENQSDVSFAIRSKGRSRGDDHTLFQEEIKNFFQTCQNQDVKNHR